MSDQDSELELELDAGKPTAIGGNGHINAIAFNMDLIETENPELAERIKELHEQVKNISPDDELEGSEEDVALVKEKFNKLLLDDSIGR
jgi:hypothetical protein